ncbi:hypothetical protein NDU88_008171 [Pleurodeles waltl]|uniref:Uncharacterized protein n=1 Tax=Pleurodeles waltl TaxID=8319 RepID=A0AAV7SUF2_PLEWA|nr:hypothetical protein NDU88_008171 [Pleurodeles waltl]
MPGQRLSRRGFELTAGPSVCRPHRANEVLGTPMRHRRGPRVIGERTLGPRKGGEAPGGYAEWGPALNLELALGDGRGRPRRVPT